MAISTNAKPTMKWKTSNASKSSVSRAQRRKLYENTDPETTLAALKESSVVMCILSGIRVRICTGDLSGVDEGGGGDLPLYLSVWNRLDSTNMRCSPDAGPLLGQRRRRWVSSGPPLGQRFVPVWGCHVQYPQRCPKSVLYPPLADKKSCVRLKWSPRTIFSLLKDDI